jgi:hypothetical protein
MVRCLEYIGEMRGAFCTPTRPKARQEPTQLVWIGRAALVYRIYHLGPPQSLLTHYPAIGSVDKEERAAWGCELVA